MAEAGGSASRRLLLLLLLLLLPPNMLEWLTDGKQGRRQPRAEEGTSERGFVEG